MKLALALLIALATPAQAFLLPPPHIDKPYPGGTTVRYFPKSEMWAQCNNLAQRSLPNHPAECGVARVLDKMGKLLPRGSRIPMGGKLRCFVYANEDFRGTETADVLIRHGRAHCHGWDHSGGIEVGKPGIDP